MEKRFRQYLKNKSNWISIITVLLAFLGLAVSFLVEEFTGKIISLLFVMIAVENFLTQITYLEDIKSKLDMNDSISLKTQQQCKPINDILANVQHTLFISGFTIITWSGFYTAIASKAAEGIAVKILVTDAYDPNIARQYTALRGHSPVVLNLDHLLPYVDLPNIEIRVIESILPTSLIAYDIDYSNAYIKAQHLINNFKSKDYPNIELNRDSEWFDRYKSFIENNWERGVPMKEHMENVTKKKAAESRRKI